MRPSAFLLLLTTSLASAAPVSVSADTPRVFDLSGHLEAHVAERGLGLEAVRGAAFEPWTQGDFSRPPGDTDAWLRVSLANDGAVPFERVLVLGNRHMDTVDAWLRGARYSAGEDTPLAERLVRHALPVFPVRLAPGETVQIHLRVFDAGEVRAPLKLVTWPELAAIEASRNAVHGLFVGGSLLLFIFSLYLAIARRERLFSWFAAYLAGHLVVALVYTWGAVNIWFPASVRPELVNRLIVLSAVCVFWASLEFSGLLLDIDQRMPRIGRWMRRVSWAYPPALLAVLLLPYPLAVAFTGAMLLPVFVPVAASFVPARQGDRVAMLYAASWAALAAAVVTAFLRVFDVVGQGVPVEYMLYTGFAFQYSVLCIAMAQKMRLIERERRLAMKAELTAHQRNAALSRSFERFVPKAFLDRLERSPVEIELGQCVEKQMTVLFADIRSFTALVERMTPEENFDFVNEYLSYMEPAIHAHLGFIDKYIGDAVMALFDDREDGGGAEQAVQAAIGMHEALRRYNTLRAERDEPPVRIGVGIHTGTLMLGTIGGRDRLNASVIGDAVNLASRVEGLTKAYGAGTLITGATAALLDEGRFKLRAVDEVRVMGKTEAVVVHELLDCEPYEVRARRMESRDAFHAARAALAGGELSAARCGLDGVLQGDPDDRSAALLRQRVQAFERDGTPDAWDGIVTLDSK